MIFLNFDSSIYTFMYIAAHIASNIWLGDGINMLRLHVFFDKAGYDRAACRADVDL